MDAYELMTEVEVLRMTDQAFRSSGIHSRYELRVSSTELIDALFEECDVHLSNRVSVLQLLHEQHSEQSRANPRDLKHEIISQAGKGANIDKLLELMKIRGST